MGAIRKKFSLRVFTGDTLWEGMKLSGEVTRRPGEITVRYDLFGDLGTVDFPPAVGPASRCDELWKLTCFELFVGVQGSPRYWECNFSPGGDWNVYRFSDYRLGMVEEELPHPPTQTITRENDKLSLAVSLPVKELIADESDLEIGVSSVVKLRRGALGYWAVIHPERRADFHSRKSFGIKIPSLLNEQSCKKNRNVNE